ncbi:MAG: undecaprenyl-phosphate glucose phosphotransferase [Bacteroidaceae bacterium]|nr:undecaprenyl-phosphate glucose phosphotransferase [Prevotellaceae bacterium]MDY5760432.1 undecaprenyl-phosphate glucose phosphotransferase [Bacteroidaceae bacterium]
MGTEKNLQLGVYLLDTVLLTAFIIGFHKLMCHIAPESVDNIKNIPWVVLVYIIGFSFSYVLFPSLIQLRLIKYEDIIRRATSTCFMMLLFVSLIIFVSKPFADFPRTFLFYSMLAYFIFMLTERIILRKILMRFRANKGNLKNVILVGNEQTVYQLFEILKTPIYGYNIVGFFYDGECTNQEMAAKRLGGTGDIYGWLTVHSNINEIYGYFPKEQHDTINMMSKFCDNHLIRFYYIPAINVFKGNMAITFMEGIPVIARREEPLRIGSNKLAKRIFDIIFSSFVLLLIFPWIFIFVSVMIKIQSPGPIFFLQERTGLDGKIFKCIKFRSMKVNNDADEIQATKNDPRKFPFGDFMRKTNIDELPQFINVFLGDMSVVGPRPHMLKHTAEYSKLINHFMVRHFAKPGITGLAQVSGFRGETRYIDQMEGRVKKDIEYIENWTFLLDLKIIVKTVTNMFGKEKGNAY